MRSDYRIKKKIFFEFDCELIFLLPTIMFQPWKYRYLGTSVVTISWLGMNIGIGIWEKK